MAKDKKTESALGLPFGKINYLLMGAALLSIIIGYFTLGAGDITLAPILLVLGYCVLFPIGIIWKSGGEETETETGE